MRTVVTAGIVSVQSKLIIGAIGRLAMIPLKGIGTGTGEQRGAGIGARE